MKDTTTKEELVRDLNRIRAERDKVRNEYAKLDSDHTRLSQDTVQLQYEKDMAKEHTKRLQEQHEQMLLKLERARERVEDARRPVENLVEALPDESVVSRIKGGLPKEVEAAFLDETELSALTEKLEKLYSKIEEEIPKPAIRAATTPFTRLQESSAKMVHFNQISVLENTVDKLAEALSSMATKSDKPKKPFKPYIRRPRSRERSSSAESRDDENRTRSSSRERQIQYSKYSIVNIVQ